MFQQNRAFHFAVLLFLWAAIYLWCLPSPTLFDDADTVHAEAVREMVQSGDWVTLKINNGIRYLEKAPLMYWLSALSVTAFGLSDWAMRLPVALFPLLLSLLVYRMGSRFWGVRTGFYAALVFVSSLGPFAFTRIFLPDVILVFFMTLALYFYLRVVFDKDPPPLLIGRFDWRCLGLYASAACAVLTKGLVGAVFIGAIIVAHIAISGRWEILKRLQILPGIMIFLIVGAPWHLAAGLSNKGFFWFYFMNEHFLRYLGLRYPKDYDTVPLWLFWILHLAWLFPWTAFLWGFGRSLPKSFRPDSDSERLNFFLYLWILVVLTFFSFSTTQEYYTFPTLPAFALLLGQVLAWLDSPEGEPGRKKALIGMSALTALGMLVGGGVIALASAGRIPGGTAELSGTLSVNPDQYALSFGHMHDLTPATFGHLSSLVYRTASYLLIGPLAALAAGFWKRWKVSALCLALMMVGLLHSYHAGMVAFEPVLSSRGLAKVIQYHYRPGDRVVINGLYERGSSINYYTGIQVSILNGHFGNLWYGSYFPDAPPIFHDDESFFRMWNSDTRVFLFSEAPPLKAFTDKHPDFSYQVLAEEGGKKILVNW